MAENPESCLREKTILLGVSGGIAAYKAPELLRLLQKNGARVIPVLTEAGRNFVTPLTLESLTGVRLVDSLWSGDDPIPHIRLARDADLVLVAPATADLIANYRVGVSRELLTAVLLATRAPVLLCPAMHAEMWEHPATRDNVRVLRERGVHILDPDLGELASGDWGKGRMPEPPEIAEKVIEILSRGAESGLEAALSGSIRGKRVLVTAGGTREAIDPVRFIGNRSSGKMGHALASAAERAGAQVSLVTTSSLHAPAGSDVVTVESAADMYEEVQSRFANSDVVIMAAAVADFRPKKQFAAKVKKSDGAPVLELEPTPDILRILGSQKRGQFLVGFAAETENLIENARKKLAEKNADLIIANDVGASDAGFESDTNRVVLLWASGEEEELPLAAKDELARVILEKIATKLG